MSQERGRAISPAAKTERLLNLVIALLYTRRPLLKEQIRLAVPQYDQDSDEAFDRMFERDKDELRRLGIPLVAVHLDSFFADGTGYRIDRREYALPEIDFAPEELAVLGLAARTWTQASLGPSATQALRKLQAAGVERDDASVLGIEPRVRTTEPSFEAVKTAVLQTVPVRFTYRPGQGEPSLRHVQPWGLASWHGRWYLTGFDTDRNAPRVFRLSRIQGQVEPDGKPAGYTVPDEHEPRTMIRGHIRPQPALTVTIRLRRGHGWSLRRGARAVPATEEAAGSWDTLTVDTEDTDRLVEELCGYGPDVLVLDPPQVRDAVRARLRGVVEAHTRGQAGP